MTNCAKEINKIIASFYHYSQGYHVEQFRYNCIAAIHNIMQFDACCWLYYHSKETAPFEVWTYNLPEFAAGLLKSHSHFASANEFPKWIEMDVVETTFFPDSLVQQKRFYSSEQHHEDHKHLNLRHKLSSAIKHKTHGGFYLLNFYRTSSAEFFNHQDAEIMTLLMTHLVNAYQLNIQSLGYRASHNWNRYRAVCDKNAIFLSVEDGFSHLLEKHSNDFNREELSQKLAEICVTGVFLIGSLKFYVLRKNESFYLELSEHENIMQKLTPAEQRVATLLRKGLKTKNIAGQIGCSPRTVEKHLGKIYQKLGTSNRNLTVSLLIDSR